MIQKYMKYKNANKSVQKIKLSQFCYFQTDVMFEVCAEMGLYPSKYQRANMQVVLAKNCIFVFYFKAKQSMQVVGKKLYFCVLLESKYQHASGHCEKKLYFCILLDSKYQHAGGHCEKILYFCILLDRKYQHAGGHCQKKKLFYLKANTNFRVVISKI